MTETMISVGDFGSRAQDRFPVDIYIWDEVAPYKCEWVKVGTARSWRGFYSLVGRAKSRAITWGRTEFERPFLSTGGPRLGTIGVCKH